MSKVIIYISGGNFQDAISDKKDIEIMVVDYDNEIESGKNRSFEHVRCDPEYFYSTLKGVET